MAAISTRFGSGGANMAPGGSGGDPSLATALRDIADDLADLADLEGAATTATIGAALGAFTDPPSAAEMATLRTRVNELRTAVLENQTILNAAAGQNITLRTTKA